MSSSIDLTSLLSSLGLTSGLDVTSIVSNLVYAESAKERRWLSQQSDITTEKAYLNYFNTLASNVSDAMSTLQDSTGALNTKTATSSQTSIVTASADASAVTGTHIVKVSNLATTASWYSDSVASSTATLEDGSFSLTIGGTSTTFEVGDDVNTLSELASSINDKDLGVTASVVTDSTGARLAIVSDSSGADGEFSITSTSGLGFTQGVEGKNASLTVDGIPISSSSNTVTGALDGVTLTLAGKSDSEVTVTIGQDTDAAVSAIEDFVSAYNTLIAQVSAQYEYTTSTNDDGDTVVTRGALAGDSTLRLFQSDLLSLISYSSGTGQYSTLGGLGISMNDDGTLEIDDDELTSALEADPSAVQTFFQGTDSNGFASKITDALDVYTDSTQGAFTLELSTLDDEYNSLQDEIDDFEDYIATRETQLTEYYNNVNVALTEMESEKDYIASLFDTGSDD